MPRCAAFLKYADQGSLNDQHRTFEFLKNYGYRDA